MTDQTDIDRLGGTAGASAPGPLIRTAALRPLLGVGRTRFYELIWEPGFPRPVNLGGGEGDLVWFRHEILDWLAGLPRVVPPGERPVVASDALGTDGAEPSPEGPPLSAAGRRRRVPTDDGTAVVPAGPEDLELRPARPGRRAS